MGSTLQPKIECRFFSSRYPDRAMQAAKKVTCQMKVKQTANPLYVQKIFTEGNGLMMPIQKDIISVSEVMVMDTAASDMVSAIRLSTPHLGEVRRQAASMTKVSSIPIPVDGETVKWGVS